MLTIKELNKILEEYINTSGIILSEADEKNPLYILLPDGEIFLPDEEEYARVMSALETWLKTNSSFRRKQYIQKAIQSTDTDRAFAYTYKKVDKDKYILIDKEEISK